MLPYKTCVTEKRTYVNKGCSLQNPSLTVRFCCQCPLTNYPGYQIMLCWPGRAIKFKNCKATSENSCICQRMQYRSWIGICFQFVLHKLCILQNLPKTYLISTRLPKRKKKISGRRTKQVAEMVKILKILYGR